MTPREDEPVAPPMALSAKNMKKAEAVLLAARRAHLRDDRPDRFCHVKSLTEFELEAIAAALIQERAAERAAIVAKLRDEAKLLSDAHGAGTLRHYAYVIERGEHDCNAAPGAGGEEQG